MTPADDAVDVSLVARAQGGEVPAFEMLVVKYQRRVVRLIGRFVRDPDLVQDVAQETFIRAYRALPQFRGDAAFYTWLYRIAVNTAKQALGDLQREAQVFRAAPSAGETVDAQDAASAPEGQDMATPETLLAGREMADAVNAAVAALPEDLRTALTLREIEGLSYDDIALAMSCPVGTVRSRIFRAREAVAARLQPLLDAGTRPIRPVRSR